MPTVVGVEKPEHGNIAVFWAGLFVERHSLEYQIRTGSHDVVPLARVRGEEVAAVLSVEEPVSVAGATGFALS
jgi:hypothetical protein